MVFLQSGMDSVYGCRKITAKMALALDATPVAMGCSARTLSIRSVAVFFFTFHIFVFDPNSPLPPTGCPEHTLQPIATLDLGWPLDYIIGAMRSWEVSVWRTCKHGIVFVLLCGLRYVG